MFYPPAGDHESKGHTAPSRGPSQKLERASSVFSYATWGKENAEEMLDCIAGKRGGRFRACVLPSRYLDAEDDTGLAAVETTEIVVWTAVDVEPGQEKTRDFESSRWIEKCSNWVGAPKGGGSSGSNSTSPIVSINNAAAIIIDFALTPEVFVSSVGHASLTCLLLLHHSLPLDGFVLGFDECETFVEAVRLSARQLSKARGKLEIMVVGFQRYQGG
ncbi:hypothetical protein K438DRAFT_1765867 [Mycena galopus ATCC 62051]|nr:hypothetical protein K438DRAFT_1765867 [Mycena galopus ATCC 62051]